MPRIGHDTVFSRYIRKVRQERGLSQGVVAARIGIPQVELSKWENGKLHRPGPERIRRAADALNVPLVNLALALVEQDPEQYMFPVLEQRDLSPEMKTFLLYDPSPREARVLLDVLLSLRREHERSMESEGEPDIPP